MALEWQKVIEAYSCGYSSEFSSDSHFNSFRLRLETNNSANVEQFIFLSQDFLKALLTLFFKVTEMAKKKKNRFNGMVYSTNSSFEFEDDNEELETLPPQQQTLQVLLDRKNRGGKTATVIKGFIGSSDDLNDLGKTLKSACGVGGSVKDGEIIIQGEKRDKVMDLLNKKGYKTKRVGG